MITIITKIELEGTDKLKTTEVGYTTDVDVTIQINEQYDSTLGAFLGENRTKLEVGDVNLGSFFNTTAFVNEARAQVESIDGLGLTEITDINQL